LKRDNSAIFHNTKFKFSWNFTFAKNFYLNSPISNQNNRVWSGGHKRDIDPRRLLVEREKFAPRTNNNNNDNL